MLVTMLALNLVKMIPQGIEGGEGILHIYKIWLKNQFCINIHFAVYLCTDHF
jgi:hypothetical protein